MSTDRISTEKAKYNQTTTLATSTPASAQTVAPSKSSVFTNENSKTNIQGNSIFEGKPQADTQAQTEIHGESETPKSTLDEYIEKHKEEFEGLNKQEILDFIKNKDSKDLTKEEKALLEVIEREKSKEIASETSNTDIQDSKKTDTSRPKTESEIRAEQKQKEYLEVYSKEGTAYEKNSRVIDKYLTENDSNYAAIKTERGKKQYKDNLIKSFREQMGLSANITPVQREQMQTDIAKIIMDAGSKGEMIITSINKNPPKCNLSKKEIVDKLENTSKSEVQELLDSIQLDSSKTPKEQLHNIIDAFLTKSGNAEYAKLKSDAEKSEYISTKIREYTQKLFALDINELEDSEKESVELLALAAFKEIKEEKININTLLTTSDKQSAFIAKVLTDNKGLLDKIKNPKTKNIFERTLYKAEIYNSIRESDKHKTIQERDILIKLKEMKKNGQIDGNTALEQLYQFYTNAEEMDKSFPKGQKILEQEANTTSLVGIASLFGMTPEKFIAIQVTDKNGKLLSEEEILKNLNKPALRRILGDGRDDVGIKLIKEFLIKNGLDEDKARKILVKAKLYNTNASRYAMARKEIELAADMQNSINKYGSKEDKVELQNIAEASTKILDEKEAKTYTDNLDNDTYSLVANPFNRGIHQNWTQAKQDSYRNSITEDSNISSERKSTFVQSYIETGSPEQQLHDAKYFSTVKNAAVTEGLAAAEQNVDSSVRQQYSQYVDNAIKNNGYTSEQKANIEQARQTGQTSYERTSSSSSSSSENASNKSSSTAAKTSSNTTPSTGKASTRHTTTAASSTHSSNSAPTSSKGTTTGAGSSYVAFGSTNYGDQVTKALADKKNRTQERITQIIDNYQKTTKAQDSKVEKQADTTSKEATSQAAKAAEKEAKVVKTFVESPQASGNIDAKTIQELKTAYSSGGMTGLYTKLGTLGETVQERFLSFFAKYSDGNSLHSFASSFSNNKSVILSLYQYSNDPSLLAYLGESATRDLLSKGKIKMKDFLKYASPSAIALYISDLNKTGNQELLKQIFGLLNLSQTSYVKQHTSKPAPGGDDWMAQLQNNMSKASGFELSDGLAMGSDRAPMGRSYDKMKQRGPFYFSA